MSLYIPLRLARDYAFRRRRISKVAPRATDPSPMENSVSDMCIPHIFRKGISPSARKIPPFPLTQSGGELEEGYCPSRLEAPHSVRDFPDAGREAANAVREVPNVNREAPDGSREAPDGSREAANAVREVPNISREPGKYFFYRRRDNAKGLCTAE